MGLLGGSDCRSEMNNFQGFFPVEMTMMDFALLERRREINRKAARKSRSRQKELANQIRKKYYDAQSANTKLVYERKRLVRERNELATILKDHRRSCPNCSIQSSDECLELLDEDLLRSTQIETIRSAPQKIPTSAVGASPLLSRSFSCPESSGVSLSQLQWTDETEDPIELSSTSDEDDEEEDEEEEEEEYDEPTSALFSADYFSSTELGIAETSGGAGDSFTESDMPSFIGDQPPLLGQFLFDEQPGFFSNEDDPFSILDDLPSPPSAQTFGRSLTIDDFSLPLKPPGGVDHFNPIMSFDSSQSSSIATIACDLGDASGTIGTYCDDQQSEAIDLSKPRATPPTKDPSSVRASTSVDNQAIEQKVREPAKMRELDGNIPLHVHDFIVGEK